MEPLKLLAVFAHPDDESMGMGGTLAKYSAEGVETTLVCATRGERGWFGPEEQNPGLGALGQLYVVGFDCGCYLVGVVVRCGYRSNGSLSTGACHLQGVDGRLCS